MQKFSILSDFGDKIFQDFIFLNLFSQTENHTKIDKKFIRLSSWDEVTLKSHARL